MPVPTAVHPAAFDNQIVPANSAVPGHPAVSDSQTVSASSAAPRRPESSGKRSSPPTVALPDPADTGSCPDSRMSHNDRHNSFCQSDSLQPYHDSGYSGWNPGCYTYSADYTAPGLPAGTGYRLDHKYPSSCC